jgi:hypothetical protein
MPAGCTWLFGRGASIACGLEWRVPDSWVDDLSANRVSRAEHIDMITQTLRKAMDCANIEPVVYRSLLEIMATRTIDGHHHCLMTTNWDYLLQREIDTWIKRNHRVYVPRFLGATSMVYHLNGSVEPGNSQHRSPFLLESDKAAFRRATYEANHAFGLLLWSTLIVVVGMSFECDIDKGLLAALKAHEDNLPIGSAEFLIVEPDPRAMEATWAKLAACFPRAGGIRIAKGLSEWVQSGLPELTNRVFTADRQ